jgi:hypothetical protein
VPAAGRVSFSRVLPLMNERSLILNGSRGHNPIPEVPAEVVSSAQVGEFHFRGFVAALCLLASVASAQLNQKLHGQRSVSRRTGECGWYLGGHQRSSQLRPGEGSRHVRR